MEASVALPGGDTVLDTRPCRTARTAPAGLLVVGRVPAGVEGAGEAADVTVRSASEGLSTRAPEPALGVAGLRALIRNELGALDAEERERVIEFVLSATADGLHGPGALNLARGLGDIREALREQLPRTSLSYDDPQALQIDGIFAVDDNSFWVRGWVHDADGTLESLVAVSPEGVRVDLLDGAYRHARLETQEMYASAGARRDRAPRVHEAGLALLAEPSARRLGRGAADDRRRGARSPDAGGGTQARARPCPPAERHDGGAPRRGRARPRPRPPGHRAGPGAARAGGRRSTPSWRSAQAIRNRRS